jgi:glycosyltransferase involved in cell wall biosynthesis
MGATMYNVKTKDYLISICVPVYNAEKYLRECLDSLIHQTYRNIEIICVNDNSKDHSLFILNEFQKKDMRIKIYTHTKNQGVSQARNTALRHVNGDFITFVDSDDYVSSEYIEYLLNIITLTNSDVSLSRHLFSTLDNKQIKNDFILRSTSESIICDFFYRRLHAGVCNKLYKRTVVENEMFNVSTCIGEDLMFNVQVLTRIKSIGIGQRKVYMYRQDNSKSLTTKANVEKQAIGFIETTKKIKCKFQFNTTRLANAVEYQLWSARLYAYILHSSLSSLIIKILENPRKLLDSPRINYLLLTIIRIKHLKRVT